MEDNNLSVVLHNKNDIRLENTKIPKPGKGRTSLHESGWNMWFRYPIGPMTVTRPTILGHETSGVVKSVGEGVTHLQVGDRVAMEPVLSCRQCDKCKMGRYNICPDMKICGIPPQDGGLTRYHVHNADLCFKLPDNVSMAEGALVEPLSVAIYAAKRGGVTHGSRVLICGAGTIGLLTLLVCKEYGAAQVCVVDIKESRLRIAKDLGADATIEVKTKDPRELASAIEQIMGGKPHISLECTGVPFCVQSAIYATDSGGCVAVVGLGPDDVTVPLVEAVIREVDIRGVCTYPNCYPIYLAMMQKGTLNVQPILTHVFKMEQSLEAFEMVTRGEGIKVMIDCTEKQ